MSQLRQLRQLCRTRPERPETKLAVGSRAARRRLALTTLAILTMLTTKPAETRAQSGPFAGRMSAGDPDANLAATSVVVFNAADPLSRDLADYYAGKRGVPAEQVVGLRCSVEEEISRQEYDDTIAGPLRAVFDERGWWRRAPGKPGHEAEGGVTRNQMRFLVLMRGVPLRIKQTANYPGDGTDLPSPLRDQNGASVDSELAVLGLYTRSISGFLPNPYFRSYSRFPDPRCPAGMMLAGRLDGPTGATVRRVIDDSLAAEKNGLWGRCYLDRRGIAPKSGPLAEGDQWLTDLLKNTAPYLLPTVDDNLPAMYGASYPLNNAALYLGWYSEQPAGPFVRPDFRFQPGAVACHIHSFSATSVRDPVKWWVGPLLEKGAAAVLGNVYEPYLALTTHLDVFTERLAEGRTLAESAYAAQPGLSWMNTVVGDPLYRPGLAWQNLATDLSDDPPEDEMPFVAAGRAYWRGAQAWRTKGAAVGGPMLEKSGDALKSGLVFEGLAGLRAGAGDRRAACAAYEKAARLYRQPADVIRVALSEANLLSLDGRKPEAARLLARTREKYQNVPEAAALEEAGSEFTPRQKK